MVPTQPNALVPSRPDETSQLLKSMAAQMNNMDGRMTNIDHKLKENDGQFTSIASILQSMQKDNADVHRKLEELSCKNNDITSHLTQVSNTVSDIQGKSSGSIPSNTVINPRGVNAISLRSGKQVRFKEADAPQEDKEEANFDDSSLPQMQIGKSESKIEQQLMTKKSTQEEIQELQEEAATVPTPAYKGKKPEEKPESSKQGASMHTGKEVSIKDLPFPNSYFAGKKKVDPDFAKDAYNLFNKLEINIPMVEFLKRNPKYAKFLKELCADKKKFRPLERIQVSANVSSLFKAELPVKCQDPGSYTIPCTIGNVPIKGALLDLGAAINVMPWSVYQALGINNLRDTNVVLQLADRTIRYPKGILEDILVQVKDLVFPADFYVLDMSNELVNDSTLILGRPFLQTSKTIISMKHSSITMEVGEHVVSFNMNEAMRYPFDNSAFTALNAIDYAVEDARDEHELSLHDNDRDNALAKGLLSDFAGFQGVLEAEIEEGSNFCDPKS